MNGLQIIRLTNAALCCEKTTRKWLRDPGSVSASTDARLRRAARSLHIKLFPTAGTSAPTVGGSQ